MTEEVIMKEAETIALTVEMVEIIIKETTAMTEIIGRIIAMIEVDKVTATTVITGEVTVTTVTTVEMVAKIGTTKVIKTKDQITGHKVLTARMADQIAMAGTKTKDIIAVTAATEITETTVATITVTNKQMFPTITEIKEMVLELLRLWRSLC